MAYSNRTECFICNVRLAPGRMQLLRGEENEFKREIAISRRDMQGYPPIPVTNQTRICLNCNKSVLNEITHIELDPACIRLNVLTQTTNNSCMICNSVVNIRRISNECRVDIFISRNIYVPENVRSCPDHLDDKGFLLRVLLPGLRFITRPYTIKGPELQILLQQLRDIVTDTQTYEDENSFTDADFQCIAPVTKNQFQELFEFCDPVREETFFRYISKKDLLLFLCKLKQGLSGEFLKVIFRYSSRQAVSQAIARVRKSLMGRFVPHNIGLRSITRNDFIAAPVTQFANTLYNPEPNISRAIVCIDGTYSHITKSSNFRILRLFYCVHKERHLVKPALIVAPDGFILEIQGPYFSDSHNNDAEMLRHEFEDDRNLLRKWFQEGDIFILDRGYLDITLLLDNIGIHNEMPVNL